MTIIETVVSLLIFAICAGGMGALIVQAKQLKDRARDHYIAVNIAKNRMERSKAYMPDQLYMFTENNLVVNSSGDPDSSGNFRRSTAVTTIQSNLVQLVVRIDIRDRISRTFGAEQESLQTYCARYLDVTP
jgi:Tfp pilus assembly protein PilV